MAAVVHVETLQRSFFHEYDTRDTSAISLEYSKFFRLPTSYPG
ncbi:MAG: hypothetical protein PVH23_00395 [candidate division WOR-3 bacterium]